MQMILAEKAEALREEADSLSTVPVPVDSSLWTTYQFIVPSLWLTHLHQSIIYCRNDIVNSQNFYMSAIFAEMGQTVLDLVQSEGLCAYTAW